MSATRLATDLHFHERGDVVPNIDPDGYDELRADIEKRGIVVPLDILDDGTVLDGRTRLGIAKNIGIESVPIRVVAPDDPFDYMVKAALLRRHLTAAQKRQLNDVLREMTVETAVQPSTGEEVRIGMGQTQRAKALGVGRSAVQEWDQDLGGGNHPARPDAPTHYRQSSGKVQPLKLGASEPLTPKPEPRPGRRPQASV